MKGSKFLTVVIVIIFGLTVWTVYSVETLKWDLKTGARPRTAQMLLGDISIHPNLVKHLKGAYVIFVDDMEGALKWTSYGNGSISREPSVAFNGEASLALETAAKKWTIIEALRLFAPPKYKVMGFAFWWMCYANNFGYLDFGIEFRNGLTGYRRAGEIYVYEFSIPYYRNEVGDLVKFKPESGLPSKYDTSEMGGDLSWHFTAIIIDFEKSEYRTLIIDDTEVDMSGIAIYDRTPKEGLAEHNMMEVFVIASSMLEEKPAKCFIDDVIVFSLPEKA